MSRMGRKKIVIVDLDGTLALDDGRAVKYLRTGPIKDWDGYFAACDQDPCNEPVADLVRMLWRNGCDIHILSGRSESVREKTEAWLHRENIPYDFLIMRGETDRTQDDVLKIGWATDIRDRVWFVLEDRARVVKSWREAGFTCLQVAPGEF